MAAETLTQIILIVDPLYDKDILEWIASFKAEDRNAALLMALRGGMASEEVSVDNLESRLDAIQNHIMGFRDDLAKVGRDIKNMKVYAVDELKPINPGDQIDLDSMPEVKNVLNKLIIKGS